MDSTRSKTTRDSDIAGAPSVNGPGVRFVRVWRSFATRLVLLVAIFAAVPVVVYLQLRAADAEKTSLLLSATQTQGQIVAESLRPLLDTFAPRTVRQLGETINRVGPPESNIKVLLRPEGTTGQDSFFYVAAAPAVPVEYLQQELDELTRNGVLAFVRESCDTVAPRATRYTNPAGEDELLVSLTPIRSKAGCWVVIMSLSTADIIGAWLSEPYWRTPQVQVALGIYLLLAVFVIWLFLDGWQALRGFALRARRIRGGQEPAGSFAAETSVPELISVAQEFDGLVGRLRETAQSLRFAAEENAHAFKTPIAVIAQSLEPVKRAVADDPRAARSAERIGQAADRLDALVQAARQMDQAAAEVLDSPAEAVDIADLLRRIGDAYAVQLADSGVAVETEAPEHCRAMATPDSFETVIENLIENAATFSPRPGTVTMGLRADGKEAVITVEDEGPGVSEADLERIFERYMSNRPRGENGPGESHFGIGLWVVRRNVTAMGGTVTAKNRPEGGFRVTIRLPAA